jgi:hypothetical protein
MVATAAALIVGGGAAAIALTMSDDSHGKTGGPTQQQPAGNQSSHTGAQNADTHAATVGISFVSGKELPAVPVAVQGAPTSVVLKDARGGSTLYVFVTGADGSVWYLAGSARTWTPLHGLKAAEPAVVATMSGNLELFAVRANDGQVMQRSLTGGTWTAKWTPVGTVRLHGALAALATQDGGIVLAGVDSGKTLVTTTGAPQGTGFLWDSWASVPGVGNVGPGVALVPDAATSGFTAYVVRASDQTVLAISASGKEWDAPKSTPLSGAPTAAATGDGTQYVFVRGSGGAVRVMNGSGQAGAGGLQTALPPSAAATADGKIAIVTALSATKLRVSYSA